MVPSPIKVPDQNRRQSLATNDTCIVLCHYSSEAEQAAAESTYSLCRHGFLSDRKYIGYAHRSLLGSMRYSVHQRHCPQPPRRASSADVNLYEIDDGEVCLAHWSIESLEISGGFLADLSLKLSSGLVCIIGPRGSGKSTMAEAIRVAAGGIPTSANKARLDLIKANLGGAVLTLKTAPGSDRSGYTIRRTYGQPAIMTSSDGRPVTDVDIDRGTFLPLDAYSSLEIEAIADETLGSKRRSLLDDLRPAEMQRIQLAVAEHRRMLEASADAIRALDRRITDLTEQIEELGDARTRLAAMPTVAVQQATPEFQSAARQREMNTQEEAVLRESLAALTSLDADLDTALSRARGKIPTSTLITASLNRELIQGVDDSLSKLWRELQESLQKAKSAINTSMSELTATQAVLRQAHATQEDRFLELQQKNQAVAQAMEARSAAERSVSALDALTKQRQQAQKELQELRQRRKELKAEFLLARDQIAGHREAVAAQLQQQAGRKVQIRVLRNADNLEYQQLLLDALRGSGLRNQDEILQVLAHVRPEDLAQIVSDDDANELEAHASFGKERGRKILDALRRSTDPLSLDVLPIDDRVCIELNVAGGTDVNFKDAAELSRGQKCTALLPILLARRETPLIIDQPEDNLDNHFIYETVVETILRLKSRRQMLFITHNANIPVLGEADLVIVMASDGRRGYVEKAGSVDECRTEIIDLLEGGEEAFALRTKRYGS